MGVSKDNLTDKQLRFCEEYIIDLNATQAALRAGYSEKTAYSIGDENLRKPEIQSKISELQKKRSKRTEITADMVLRELAIIGFSKITDYLKVTNPKSIEDVDVPFPGEEPEQEEQGCAFAIVEVLDTDKMKPEAIPAIASIKQGRNGIELKLHDKVKALEGIGRHLGMFNDKVDVTSKGESLNADDLSKLSNEEKLQLLRLKQKMRGKGE
jgi:phage terminase small subunit